jgi:hypothetical protein
MFIEHATQLTWPSCRRAGPVRPCLYKHGPPDGGQFPTSLNHRFAKNLILAKSHFDHTQTRVAADRRVLCSVQW